MQSGRGVPWLLHFALLTSHFSFLISSSAEDRVVIQQPGGSRFPVTGIVEDYTGRDLTIRQRVGDKLRSYPRSDVVEVQTSYTAHHDKGRQLLANGQAVEAAVELNAAVKEEDRTWVRREILALLVKGALWDGDYRTAVSRFLLIADSDAETFHFGVAPLAWTDDPPTGDLRLEAKSWLAARSPITKLFGASHLLSDPASTIEAETVLRFLSRESNVRVQRLAQMQLWRQRMKTGAATPAELSRWEAAVEELPVELRAGGYFVLGQAHRRQQEPERAAAALLWLPLVYDADRHLAARACFQAAEQIESLGDRPQATNLFSEVVFRFGDTPWGPQAEKKWTALTNAAKAGQ
jgi:hypothetical protein